MITSVNPGIQYTCNSCGQNSKLSIQEPEDGFYKVTCFHCSAESIIRITHQSGLIRVSNTDKNHPELNPPASEAAEIEENSIDLVSGSTGESKGFFKSILNTFESIVSRLNVTFLKFRGRIFPLISGLSSGSTGNKKPFFEKVVKHHPAGLKDAIFTFHSVKRNFGKNFPSFQFGGKNKIVVGSALLIFPVIIFFSYFIYGIFEERNGISELLSELSKNKPTRILDRKGKVISEIFSRKTSSLKLKDYPASLISIVLGVEDRGFYKHHGIDYFAIIRAIFTNTFSMSYKQGASTITQQLARILIKDRRKSLLRKMREAQVAFALESKLSKDEILEAYMNEVYLGHGAYGFGDASMFYFEKSPTALSELEMVLLSSLASAPGKYSPLKNPQISQVRFNAIINSLRNKQIIRSGSESEIKDLYSGLKRAATDTVFSTRFDQAKYVTEHIREILKSIDPSINIYEEGGYLVETTLVSDIQSSAGEIVKQYISELNQK
ncbi:MAG: transglycosylase domain-containing protein, partial [Leptospira sp.]|nr:transglycosylase domain-containing protein [Leptospira sp.]